MRKVRENIIPLTVAGLEASGTTVFNATTGVINIAEGKGFWYNEVTGLTVDPSTTAPATIVFAVPITVNGVKTLLKPFGDRIVNSMVRSTREQCATGGRAANVQLMFDCTACDENYSFQVTWENDQTQNTFPYNRHASETISVQSPCCAGCNDCDTTANCIEVANRIVAFVDGTLQGADPGFGRKAAIANALSRPYYAQVLLAEKGVVTINTDALGLVNEDGVPASLNTINGVDVSACSPGTQTLHSDIPCIVSTVNADADNNIIISQLPGGDYEFHITSATVDPAASALVWVDPAGTPSQVFVVTTPIATSGLTCGVDFVSRPELLECDCFPPNPPIAYKSTALDIAIGTDWTCGQAQKIVVQMGEEPENTGYDWQWKEYVNDNGGSARTHRPYNVHRGPIHLPQTGDRAKNPTLDAIDCTSGYCSTTIEHNIPVKDTGVHGNVVAPRGRTVMITTDAATHTAFNADLDAWLLAYGVVVQ